MEGTHRGRRRPLAALAAGTLVSIVSIVTVSTGWAAAQGGAPAALAPVAQVDLDSFSARAQAWTTARTVLRQDDLDRADRIAADAKAAEDEALVAAEEEAEETARAEAEEAARVAAEAEAARVAAEEAARVAATTTTTTTVAPAPPAPSASGPGPAQWAALRSCESGGRYTAVSSNGRYRGAYQFSQATWDWVAGVRSPDLIGVDPAAAAPAQQDLLAQGLYDLRGASPWPHCGASLL